MDGIEESEGRHLFGLDVARYDQGRPPYPSAFYSLLLSEGALLPGAATLEIGPGSGIATRRLIEAGASPITLIEPDERFREPLRQLGRPSVDLRLLTCAFEDAELDAGTFDLIVAATSFHWLAPGSRIDRIAALARDGGYVALVWNLFQDADRNDEFHEATKHLLEGLAVSPSAGADALPFPLDRRARESEFCDRGLFERAAYAEIHWTLELDVSQVRSLYQSFSSIARLPELERTRLLDQISEIVADAFDGSAVRCMTTPIYLFRRRSFG